MLSTSNHYNFMLLNGIDFSADVFKIILMDDTFAFDRKNHSTYSAVSAQELPTGFGYTQKSKVLAGVSVAEDNINDRGVVSWSDALFTAIGGQIGPISGAVIFDDSTSDGTVVGFIGFGTPQIILGDKTLTVSDLTIYNS